MTEVCAKDILSEKVITADAESRIRNEIDKIRKNNASHAVIYDKNTFSGVVPLTAAFVRNPQRIFADLLPREPLPEIPSCTTIQALGHLFAAMPIDAVSVIDEEGTFIGIVSEESLLRALLKETRKRMDELSGPAEANLKEKITGYIKEKEVLLKEIHHRVKNNMQVISSLLKLQLHTITDQHAKESMQACINRIRSMALVHENLYQTEFFSDIQFGDCIKTLVTNLLRAYDITDISALFEMENVRLCMDKAIPCCLIINELVTNCIVHAFPGTMKGEIRLKLSFDDNSGLCIVSVHDNGTGLPPDADYTTARSSGFTIIKLCASQLRGEVGIIKENGTKFILSFPIPRGPAHSTAI